MATPRSNALKDDEYYMALASLTAFRSKDPDEQCGAVIVDPATRKVFGIGWNGMPEGTVDLPWDHKGKRQRLDNDLMDKLTYGMQNFKAVLYSLIKVYYGR